jgi:sigma-B regulation protein RsbU (phosphoserine phosphatase)
MASAPASAPPPQHGRRLHVFWERVTEGMELNQLWAQFKDEARSSYGLYSKDIRRTDYAGLPPVRRWLHMAGDFFWAVMTKLTPARRVILLAGLVLLVAGRMTWTTGNTQTEISGSAIGGLLILLVLVLEIADRIVMKRDLEIAREIQRWLVPEKPPVVPGYEVAFMTRSANTVGGDYYDVLPIGDANSGRYLVAIADVAGKSMPAALLMATFQASLHTLSATCESLVELVNGVNHYASAHSLGGLRFTTAVIGMLDAPASELLYTNAGHNHPILMRAGGSIERLDQGGLPLGIMADARYECGQQQLASGDTLVIFTDGVVEAVNEREEEYGEGRLLALVTRLRGSTAQQVLEALKVDLRVFVGQARQHDDITCIVVRRQ